MNCASDVSGFGTMDAAKPIASKVALTLDLPPSCIQFCPAHIRYFVVGTYNLQKEDEVEPAAAETETVLRKPQSRNGSLVVFKTDGHGHDLCVSQIKHSALFHLTMIRTQVQTESQPSALLDLRFHPAAASGEILAIVSSTGTLAIFKLDPETNPSSPLQHLATSRCEDLGEDVLFLQCQWHPSAQKLIGVTTSTGLCRLLYLDKEWKVKGSMDVNVQNSLEAWSVAFAPTSPFEGSTIRGSIYCGGDDSLLRYVSLTLDQGVDAAVEVAYNPVAVKGLHNAGVTAILPLSAYARGGGRLVLTGSYDDHLRLFAIHDLHDSHGLKRIELLAEKDLGGGVWRLDLVDCETSEAETRVRVLASCMHAGARIVDIISSSGGSSWACWVVARFEEHKSMNYGSDFARGAEGSCLRCVSTSFYDKLLCLWEYEPDTS